MTLTLRCSAALALALALAHLPALPARADHGPVLQGRTLTAYLLVAQAHWGAAPRVCTGTGGQPVPVHAALFDDPRPAVAARAEQPGCRLWLDRDFWPARPSVRGCVEIAHEWGHLLGFGHGSRGLMAEDASGFVPGCAAFRPRRLKRLAPRRTGRALRKCMLGYLMRSGVPRPSLRPRAMTRGLGRRTQPFEMRPGIRPGWSVPWMPTCPPPGQSVR